MKHILHAAWAEDDGVMAFEWVLLVTVIVIGIVGGLSAARDGIIDELGDAAQAAMALDQSWAVDGPLGIALHTTEYTSGAHSSSFLDYAEFDDCERNEDFIAQAGEEDEDS